MKKLDLHGTPHIDVRAETIRFIEANLYKDDPELEIVTGHSTGMKEIVGEVLDEYDLDWQIGDHLEMNMGFIRVQLP